MSSFSAVAFDLIVKFCVRVSTKHHIAGVIEDPIGGVCGTIIEDLVDLFVRALGGSGLLGANGTRADE